MLPAAADRCADARAGAMELGPAEPSALTRAFIDARLSLMRQSADLVRALPGRAPADYPAVQVALLLLVFCVAPKADHLLRHLPPAVSAPLAVEVDRLVLETFQAILGARLSTAQLEQAQLPLSMGEWV